MYIFTVFQHEIVHFACSNLVYILDKRVLRYVQLLHFVMLQYNMLLAK